MSDFAFESIGEWTARRALLSRDRTAIVYEGKPTSFGELDRRANQAAAMLQAAGVAPGDRVAVLAGNSPRYAEVFLACAKMGAIVVPLNWRLAPGENEYVLNDSGARVLVYEDELRDAVKAFAPAVPVQTYISFDGSSDALSYEAALAAADGRPPENAPAAGDVLALIYTSGTTGRPKGAMLTHGNFFWTNLNILLALDITSDERSVMVLPMFHVGGWNVNTLSVWWKGGCVLMERSFDPGACLQLIAREGATSMMGVPAIYSAMAQHVRFESTDLGSLRYIVCGGAPAPETLIRTYEERGVKFIQGYGLTEAAPNTLVLPAEDSRRKLGSVGFPYFFIDVDVVDEEGRSVGPGGRGEVVARGPSIMKGYWRRPDATADALRGGWLHTGDVARVDEEGYTYIVDRIKDMIISGGENIYPAEVENILHEHPAILDAGVIGVPDERWGEVPRAVVVAKSGAAIDEDEVIDFCRARLAGFKVPKSVVFTEDLPRTPSGKIIKLELRRLFGGGA